MANIELLRRVIEYMNENPWDATQWPECFAGCTAKVLGRTLSGPDYVDGEHVSNWAEKQLGLSYAQSKYFFYVMTQSTRLYEVMTDALECNPNVDLAEVI